jgi:Penicillin tolerance protein
VGEIIHNPEVNHQIASLGIKNLTGRNKEADISDLGPDDVVIVPAFGTELSIQQQIKDRGCQIVDTTCGDVMSVWKRVRKYASESLRLFTARRSTKRRKPPVRARSVTAADITLWS